MGRIELRRGHRDLALQHLRKALELSPQNPEAYFNLAEAELAVGNLDDAIANYERTLVLKPVYPDARFGLAQAVRLRRGWAEAIPHYQIAAAQAPDSPVAHHALASALVMGGHVNDALRLFEEGVKKWPTHADLWVGLGSTRFVVSQIPQAIEAYEKAIELAPQRVDALDGLVECRRRDCDWRDDMLELEQRLRQAYLQAVATGQNVPMRIFTALYTPFGPAELLAIARSNAQGAKPVGARPLMRDAVLRDQGRIRVGYLIADVRNHPNAHNTLLLYGLHDRQRFEVFTYSWGPDDNSPYRQKILRDSEHFVEMRGWSDEAMAQRIAADGIHILVDLMGHTGDNRMGVLARRPAPVQINYLGFPGTSGADFVDYIIGDPVVTPLDRAGDFSESLIILPDTYQINSVREVPLPPPLPRAQLGLPEQGFVYCCFNNPYKIDPHVFGIWMDILSQVPGSVLWLFQGSARVDAHLRAQAERAGIDPARLVFAPSVPREQHIARIQAADLFLDTDRYNAHTTASDALWAGVPLLTVPGETFASRVAASLLRAAQLPDCVQPDWDAYASKAVALAQQAKSAELQNWKQHLRERRMRLPVFDTPRLVRHLEAAYMEVDSRVRAGQPPSHLVVGNDRADDHRNI
ncbi:tetratricopeptide repeat protein [Thiomonas sp.]|uniref:O-linked N-acetylglucosamine transferase, SPINDLY family protein n=1 Tax=Thiomonas sp. TaxID=2047785 RepID=UPI00260DD12E|nr:tetratricopeptide repeat protein [Thiomonas sp.]